MPPELPANQLTAEQYAQRAGVGVDRVIGDFGNFSIAPVSATNPQALPGTITPESLASTKPVTLAVGNQVPPYPVNNLPEATIEQTGQEEKISQETSTLRGLYDSLLGRSTEQTAAETKYGVDTARANLNDLNAQLTALKNEALAIPVNEQSRAARGTVLTSGLIADQNQKLRDNAVAALGVSSLLAASQGQLANAQALADRAVAQKYDPIEEQIAVRKANLDLLMNDPLTSLQDKNRALKQKELQDAKALKVAEDKAIATEIWNIATTAATNQAGFKPTGTYPTSTLALNAISKAPTREQALAIAVETGLIGGTTASEGTSDIKEYDLAKSQGFKGTFQQWVDRSTKYKGGGGTTPKAATKDQKVSLISKNLLNEQGEDRYVSPEDWSAALNDWVSQVGTVEEFTKKFGYLVNPADPQDYRGYSD